MLRRRTMGGSGRPTVYVSHPRSVDTQLDGSSLPELLRPQTLGDRPGKTRNEGIDR